MGSIACKKAFPLFYLSANGSIVAFGIPNEMLNGVSFTGKVKVFKRQGNSWVQKGADIDGDDTIIKFGQKVSLSQDGNVIAINQTGNSGAAGQGTDIGRVKIYQFTKKQWMQLGNTIQYL